MSKGHNINKLQVEGTISYERKKWPRGNKCTYLVNNFLVDTRPSFSSPDFWPLRPVGSLVTTLQDSDLFVVRS